MMWLRLGLRISGLPCNYWRRDEKRRDGRASDMSLKNILIRFKYSSISLLKWHWSKNKEHFFSPYSYFMITFFFTISLSYICHQSAVVVFHSVIIYAVKWMYIGVYTSLKGIVSPLKWNLSLTWYNSCLRIYPSF